MEDAAWKHYNKAPADSRMVSSRTAEIASTMIQGITGYRAARQGEPENQNFGFSGLLSHNVAIF